MLLLFWQISALDLESINVKFYFTGSMCLNFLFFVVVVVDFCYSWCGVPYFVEAKGLGYIHTRSGPNKVGFVGLFQPFRDAVKLLTKEQHFPLVYNYLIYYFSPIFVFYFPYWFGY